jgi:putative oxidoreductase
VSTRATAAASTPRPGLVAYATRLVTKTNALFECIPHSLIALLARFSLAMTFWLSGQTKVEGLVLDPISGTVQLGIPRISENALELFRSEYALPLIPPELAAPLAAVAEHLFPLLLLVGLATRLSALVLLGMTLVIQLFVYPSAFATHGLWAVSMLYIMARGPGVISVDHWIARRTAASRH